MNALRGVFLFVWSAWRYLSLRLLLSSKDLTLSFRPIEGEAQRAGSAAERIDTRHPADVHDPSGVPHRNLRLGHRGHTRLVQHLSPFKAKD
jgi:hypothetical protein